MKISKIKHFFKKAAPQMITGAADNDPSGIATYSISGAMFGYGQLWLMVIAAPMLIAVQSMCSKLGNIQRKGLSVILKEQFHPWVGHVAAVMLVISNVFIIGADILAMGQGMELLTTINTKFWILPITILAWYFILFKNFRSLSKWLYALLLFYIAYVIAAVLAHPHIGEVVRGLFVPNTHIMNHDFYVSAVAVLGTTITPYLFFWQVKEEVEEKKNAEQAKRDAAETDSVAAPGYILSQLITIFIIVATGATLHAQGVTINTAADAAQALMPVAGKYATIIFALGIIGAGFIALPVLTASTSYVVSESFGWRRDSLNNKVKSAKGFYAVITLALLSGVGMYTFGVDPIKSLYYSQVLAGVLAPPLLVLIMILVNRRSVVGEFRNGWFDNIFGTGAIVLMTAVAVLMFV